MAAAKFYYYNIWVESEDGNRLEIDEAFNDQVFQEDNYHINSDKSKHYFAKFQQISVNQYHGIMMRAKDEKGFLRLDEDRQMDVLSAATDGDGHTGSIDRDYVNFGMVKNTKNIDILLEVGYQTPGILKLKEYLGQHIASGKVDKIGHETRMPELTDEKLHRILNSELKKAEISFKKNPKSVAGDDAEETLSNLVPDNYRLKFEASLEQGKEEHSSMRDFLDDFLSQMGNNDADEIPETIRQIDFPRIMNTFKLVGFEDGEEEVEENLAATAEVEEIDISDFGLFDEDLGEFLCRTIIQKQ